MDSIKACHDKPLDKTKVNAEKYKLVKFAMYILVSRDWVSFCTYIKRHVYPGNQGTQIKLNQMQTTALKNEEHSVPGYHS